MLINEDIDLTKDPEQSEFDAPGLSIPSDRPYDPTQHRETMRGVIALILVACLCFIVLFSLMFVVFCIDTERLRTVLDTILSPVVGLVGAATGFYFGEKSR